MIRSFYKSNDDWNWLQKEDHLVRILKMLLTLSPPDTLVGGAGAGDSGSV